MTTERDARPIEPGPEAGIAIFRMMHLIRRFELGLTMTEGTSVEWRKAVGEPVQAGEILLVVETDKTGVEAPASGTLSEIIGVEKGAYPVGEVIAVLEAGVAV